MERFAIQRPGPEPRGVRATSRRLRGLLIALALYPLCAGAEPAPSFDEAGRFYVQNFAPEDYGAKAQNWAVAQSREGLIYVANGAGVLEYDGVSWHLFRVANKNDARSLAVDAGGRVYVGATGELGYLAPGAGGGLAYVSLLEHIPEEDREFAEVWRAFALSDGVYFPHPSPDIPLAGRTDVGVEAREGGGVLLQHVRRSRRPLQVCRALRQR